MTAALQWAGRAVFLDGKKAGAIRFPAGEVDLQKAYKTPGPDAMSKDLKRRGFKFVGSTICYAFMQAVGMVNDHVVDCFRHGELRKTRRR